MDFKRLELILLAVFVALDIFLFVSYNQNQDVFFSTDVSQTKTESLHQDMKDDSITVPKLSTKKEGGYYLASRPDTRLNDNSDRLTGQSFTINSDDELTSHFYQPISYKKGQAVAKAKTLLKEKTRILYGRAYEYAPELSSTSQLVFVQKHNSGGVIFDTKARLTFQLDDQAIVGYTQHYVHDFIVLREKSDVISAKTAVNNLYTDSEISTNSTIVWYRLAYYGFLDAKGSTIYIPTWYIGIKDNSTKTVTQKQINGFTGALIKAKSSENTYVDD